MDLDQIYGETSDMYRLASKRVQVDTNDVLAWKNLLTVHQYRSLFRWIDHYAPPGALVLDWGCGAGMLSTYLIQAGFTVRALDVVRPLLITELREAGEAYAFTSPSDPRKLPYAAESFDVVLSAGVLEHVRETGGDEVSSLREIRRVLKTGGVFICCHFPNRRSWIEWTARRSKHRHHHEFRYAKADIMRLTAASDLTVKEVKRYGFLPRNSLGRLPPLFGESPSVVRWVDRVDEGLGTVLGPLVQNFGFVAVRDS